MLRHKRETAVIIPSIKLDFLRSTTANMPEYRPLMVHLLLVLVLSIPGLKADKLKRLESKLRLVEAKINLETTTLREDLDDALETWNNTEKCCLNRVTEIFSKGPAGEINAHAVSKSKTTLKSDLTEVVGVVKRAFDVILAEIQKLTQKQVAIESKIDKVSCQSKLLSRLVLKQGYISSFGSSYYFLIYKYYNWTDAKKECESYGAYLAEVSSEEERKFLSDMNDADKAISSKELLWLGSNDIDSEGQWIWAHSKTPLTVTYWREASNEPNGKTKENCLQMYSSFHAHSWNDLACSREIRAICEFSV